MGGSAATPEFGGVVGMPDAQEATRRADGLWWLWLIAGLAWIVASLVILQFDEASVKAIGIILGLMFTFAAAEQFVMATVADSLRWLWAMFGLIFLIAGGICFLNPEDTFAGLADILGFLFLTVGVWWMIRAFLDRDADSAWWLGLVCGILMVTLAFWTSGQFFLERAYTLLAFAGIWAMMQGITNIVRAFALRAMHDQP